MENVKKVQDQTFYHFLFRNKEFINCGSLLNNILTFLVVKCQVYIINAKAEQRMAETCIVLIMLTVTFPIAAWLQSKIRITIIIFFGKRDTPP